MINQISLYKIGATSQYKDSLNAYYPYFVGGCCAMLFGGIFHDTVFNGKVFFTIAVISVFHVLWEIVILMPFVN